MTSGVRKVTLRASGRQCVSTRHAARHLLNARAMRRALAILFASLLLIPLLSLRLDAEVAAPDEGRAGMCAEYDGIPFAFCVAICEARQCDRLGSGDDRCTILQRGFRRVAGVDPPPCMGGTVVLAAPLSD